MDFEKKIDSTSAKLRKGGAPVGKIEDLSDEEFLSIYFYRCWLDGVEGQKRIEAELRVNFGYEKGYKLFNDINSLFQLLSKTVRRNLARHNIDCNCVGADESCFSQLVIRAANNEREDAMLIATLLADVHFASKIVDLAEKFGLGMKYMSSKHSETIYRYYADSKSFH